ncbi:MAG: hypothetical protein HYR90_02565 [Candidatus Andersenbacteria bacterium]|nr:hypothetical protein [Candidatus Andersenbacteria bacterium]MBI3251040.1 hypothetical protein [Candidatus Andersenbacteria bacterium]
MSIATLRQAQQVLNILTQEKVSCGQLQWLIEGGFITDLLKANRNLDREAFRKFLSSGQLYPTVMELTGVVIPEKEKTLGDRIADGAYDGKNGDITEKRCPLSLPPGPRNLVLVHFGRVVLTRDVEQWAAENGYEIALIDDLLAVGSHPEYKITQPPRVCGVVSCFYLLRPSLFSSIHRLQLAG